jgi:flagellar biosynthesis/type III secretory pathway protein FliH
VGRVIKADRHGPTLIPGIVHDAQRRAADILELAQQAALRAHAEARASGLAQGLAEGRARAADELIQLVAARARVIREVEHDAMKASLQIAEHLVRTTVEAKPEAILAMLAPLLARIRHASNVRVHAHEEDAVLVKTHADALAAHVGLDGVVDVVVDPALQRGDLLLTSNVGELDSRIAIRLEDLEASWRGGR